MHRNRDLGRKQVQGVNSSPYHPPLPMSPPQQLFQSQPCSLGVHLGPGGQGRLQSWAAGLWAGLPLVLRAPARLDSGSHLTAGQTWLLPAPVLHVEGFSFWLGVVLAAGTPWEPLGLRWGGAPRLQGSITGCDRGGFITIYLVREPATSGHTAPSSFSHPCGGCQRCFSFPPLPFLTG